MPFWIKYSRLAGVPLVVKGVASEFLRLGGVKGDVEALGAVGVGAEHVGRDKAGACVIALVAQNAIEFERVADGFVNLQDHLIRSQHQIHDAGGAIGRGEQLDGL